MGVIQSSINQMLGTAGIAARLSPGLETRAQIREAKKAGAQLSETTKQLSKEVTNIGERIQAEASLGLQEKRIEQAKKEQELGLRTPGNAAKIIQNEQKSMGIAQALKDKKIMIKPLSPKDFLIERQNQAMGKVAQKNEAKQTQKRNFMSYLKNQPISGGGLVGELPANILKQIASQYSKTQRKQLMDTMDAQKEKNK